jgi:hypothetical protein
MGTGTILTDLPTRPGWYFGGFRYGLEPLTLPTPDAADVAPGQEVAVPPDYAEACRSIFRADRPGWADDLGSVDELFWFRWITGHQVSFVIWRLMAQALHDVRAGLVGPASVVGPLCEYVRGYCAMLLYTSSCSRQVYERLIRPSMYLQHRGFSGSWAPDFGPVRDLLRGRPLTGVGGQEAADLRRAATLYRTVHEGVAAKLVPGGQSLLQDSVPARRAQDVRLPDTRVLGFIYDSYFLTRRAPVTRLDIAAQLVRRLVAISQDLAANGFYPSTVAGAGDKPYELCSADVVECEQGLTRIAYRIANFAVGQSADDSAGQTLAGLVRSSDVI